MLGMLLSGLARHIAANMPPEAGMDARAVFATLAARFGMGVRDVTPEEIQAVRAAQAASQDPAPEAPELPPAPEPIAEPPAIRHRAASATAPRRAVSRPAKHPAATESAHTPSPCGHRHALPRRPRPEPVTDRRARRSCRALHRRYHAPPIRRLTYAACAGPP